MTRFNLLIIAIAIAAVSVGTIGTPTPTPAPAPSGNQLSKREVLEFYPDWVPFKNKHGDELGEFVDVNKPKAKVKKRLALPMNFLMRAVSDDFEDVGGGESDDGDEYFEKKDWSDLNRNIKNVSLSRIAPNISDIDGVLEIITQESPSLADDINNSIPKQIHDNQKEVFEDNSEEEKEYIPTTTPVQLIQTENPHANIVEQQSDFPEKRESKQQHNDDYEDDQDESTTKKPELSEEEQKENERKKKIILDSVDKLKQRHEEEQKAISEKAKDEDYKTELATKHKQGERTNGRSKYKQRRWKMTTPDYEEYEDLSWTDKYKINIERKTNPPVVEEPKKEIFTSPSIRDVSEEVTTQQTETTTEKRKGPQTIRYSVFNNPNLFMVDNDEDELRDQITHKKINTPRKFSSKYNAQSTDSAENIIYPTTTENTEKPILYFPKIKKQRKLKKKITSTTPATDSYVAETVEDKLTRTTQPISYPGASAGDTTDSYKSTDSGTAAGDTFNRYKSNDEDYTTSTEKEESTSHDREENENEGSTTAAEDLTSAGELPSGEAESIHVERVTDAIPASSDHTKEEPKDYHVEKGGGHEHHSSHEEEHEEHGKKAYEGLHKDSKSKKGHHDKEDHLGKYEDRGGHDKKHHDESGHYGAHHHEEHGKKHAKYEESGKHSKGHSTKGSHDIHKKEEYEKKVEFFEEEGDSADEEKHAGYHNEKEHKSGGQFKKGNLKNEHNEKKHGESGHFAKGGHHDVNKGHKSSGGHDSHGKHGGAHHAAGGKQGGKKWVYHHGSPAKNSNLIVIDRRGDRYIHGPTYFG